MFQGNGCLSWLDKHIITICEEVGKEINNMKEQFRSEEELSVNQDVSSLLNDIKQTTQCDISKCTGIVEKEALNLSTYFCKSCKSIYDDMTNDPIDLPKTPNTYKLTLSNT